MFRRINVFLFSALLALAGSPCQADDLDDLLDYLIKERTRELEVEKQQSERADNTGQAQERLSSAPTPTT